MAYNTTVITGIFTIEIFSGASGALPLHWGRYRFLIVVYVDDVLVTESRKSYGESYGNHLWMIWNSDDRGLWKKVMLDAQYVPTN